MPRDEGDWQPGGSPRRSAPLPEATPPDAPPRGLLQYQSRQDAGQVSLSTPGGIRLFRIFGVTVFLHWSWFLIALYEMQQRNGVYSSLVWNVIEVLFVLAMVLLHELGHAMACRSVKGTVDRIVLWPLGGAAYIRPPARPAPMLWSVAAGPLVNVALYPILFFAADAMKTQGSDLYMLFASMAYVNRWLLVFNLLPIYPLDGGQILRALLWFVAGPAWSLLVAASVGILGAAGVAIYAVSEKDTWIGFIAVFMGVQAWNAIKLARTMLGAPAIARRDEAACPNCGKHPPLGALWSCGCGARFDTFEHGASCPRCGQSFGTTRCVDCGQPAPISAWMPGRVVPVAALAAAPATTVRHPPLPPEFPRD
jgi:Zn-dependent protease